MVYLARKVFLSLDPISAMHLGLSNDKDQQYRAELLSHFILRKVPNTLIQDECGKEFFERKRESQKLELTRSQKLRHQHSTMPTVVTAADNEDPDLDQDGFGDLECTSATVLKKGRSTTEMFTRVHSKRIRTSDLTVEDLDVEGGGHTPKLYQPSAAPDPAVAVEAARAEGTHRVLADHRGGLPALRELFCEPETFLCRSTGLSLVDSVAVYAYITQAGCENTEDLLLTLKEAKTHRPCTCRCNSSADAGTASHGDQCSSRRAGVWAEALTKVGVPYFHAIKTISVGCDVMLAGETGVTRKDFFCVKRAVCRLTGTVGR